MDMKRPTIKSAMTPFPYTIQRDAPLMEARRKMLELRIRHLPVLDGNELVGILSDRDLKLILGPEFDYPDPRELTVADALVEDAYVVDLDEPLDRVLLTMADRHIGAALVVRKGALAGIFTSSDACRQFGEMLLERYGPGDGGDAAA